MGTWRGQYISGDADIPMARLKASPYTAMWFTSYMPLGDRSEKVVS